MTGRIALRKHFPPRRAGSAKFIADVSPLPSRSRVRRWALPWGGMGLGVGVGRIVAVGVTVGVGFGGVEVGVAVAVGVGFGEWRSGSSCRRGVRLKQEALNLEPILESPS